MQELHGLFAGNRREVVQKLFEPVPACQVIKQTLRRNAGANKDYRPTHHVRGRRHYAGLKSCIHMDIINHCFVTDLLGFVSNFIRFVTDLHRFVRHFQGFVCDLHGFVSSLRCFVLDFRYFIASSTEIGWIASNDNRLIPKRSSEILTNSSDSSEIMHFRL